MIEELKNKKLLVICESPNKVSHIREYLKKAGYNVTVAASVGHIMTLANGGNYYNSGIDPQNDFSLDLQISDDKRQVVAKLREQAKAADYVYLFTDPDREGSVIAWSLVKFLKIPKAKYRRIITHEITPMAVVKALENPIPLEEDLIEAGLARMTLDKMIGFSLSPVAKRYVGAKSVGRVQSVGLKLIVDREKEIKAFVPETYFDLYLHFNKNNVKFKAKFAGNNTIGNVDHLATQAEVDAVKANCINGYVVENIKRREKEESPKPPFCTATFQQEAANKLNLKVKDAMSVAQKLFEVGRITYMRTDATNIAAEFIPVLQKFIESTYGKKAFTKPRQGKKQENSQEGHECLRVTDPSLTPELFATMDPNALHQKVYRLIWQRTVAAALPNAKISETQYLIDNNGEKFILTSNEITELGYRNVYSYRDEDDKTSAGPVRETFEIGERLDGCSLQDQAKQTKPPVRFSEASLIKELQKRGLGRPSTFASIVETVLSTSRGYAELQDKAIVPTERGIQLAGFLDRSFSNLINLEYTSNMEKDLDLIARGKKNKVDFLKSVHEALETAIKSNSEGTVDAEHPAQVCPNCGAPMVVRRSKFGKLFYGCSKYPACTGIINIK